MQTYLAHFKRLQSNLWYKRQCIMQLIRHLCYPSQVHKKVVYTTSTIYEHLNGIWQKRDSEVSFNVRTSVRSQLPL